jgi:membrane associated rhomboid family serine protease
VRPPPKPPPALLPQKAREAIALARVQQLAEQARGPDFDSAPPDEWWKSIAAFLGMPVEFDAPAEERRPVVTWFLAAVIIMASVHSFFHLHEAVQLFGLIPAQATRMHGLTFVTSFFLHAGIIHLIGNMYFLLVFGDDVENFLRPLRYIGLIAIAAFVGDLIHIASEPNSTIPCIGASGGIAGVITFYALAFPEAKVGFLWRYFLTSIGFDCRPGSFSCSGFFFKLSARMSKRSESARSRHLRIWAAPRSGWRRGQSAEKALG